MKTRTILGCRFFTGSSRLALLAAGLLFWIPSGVFAQGNEPGDGGDGIIIVDPPDLLPCPTLRAESILEPGAGHQDLKVFYPWWLNVDRESLGDGDIVVSGPGEYLQRGQLIGVEELRDEGISILLVEQNATLALDVADHAVVLANGAVAAAGDPEDLKNDKLLDHLNKANKAIKTKELDL